MIPNMDYPTNPKRVALSRIKKALFHLDFKDRVKVLVATLKQLDIKASDLENEYDQKEPDTN